MTKKTIKLIKLIFTVFILSICNSCSNNVLQVEVPEQEFVSVRNSAPIDFGFNTNIAHEKSWLDTSYLNKIKLLSPKVLRIPGGTVANFYELDKKKFHNSSGEFKKHLASLS